MGKEEGGGEAEEKDDRLRKSCGEEQEIALSLNVWDHDAEADRYYRRACL